MTHKKYNLFRKAQGTNAQFHLDGKLITCNMEVRSGIGAVYLYSTDDAREASRLQIVHQFKIDVRAVLPNIDRAQIADLGASEPVKEKPKRTKTKRTRKPRAKKSDT